MKVKTQQVDITLTGQEARDIAYHIKYSLENTIKTHWNQLQQNQDGENLFFERSKGDLRIMEELFCVCADNWSYKNSISEFKKLFAERRKEREITTPNKDK